MGGRGGGSVCSSDHCQVHYSTMNMPAASCIHGFIHAVEAPTYWTINPSQRLLLLRWQARVRGAENQPHPSSARPNVRHPSLVLHRRRGTGLAHAHAHTHTHTHTRTHTHTAGHTEASHASIHQGGVDVRSCLSQHRQPSARRGSSRHKLCVILSSLSIRLERRDDDMAFRTAPHRF